MGSKYPFFEVQNGSKYPFFEVQNGSKYPVFEVQMRSKKTQNPVHAHVVTLRALSMWYSANGGYMASATVLMAGQSAGTPQPSSDRKCSPGYIEVLWSMGPHGSRNVTKMTKFYTFLVFRNPPLCQIEWQNPVFLTFQPILAIFRVFLTNWPIMA